MAKSTVYLQIKPSYFTQWSSSKPQVSGMSLVRATATRPRSPVAGTVLVKLTLDIDNAAFLPFEPEAVVHVKPGQTEPIEVTVNDPDEEEE